MASALAAGLVGWASMTASTREYMHRYWATGFPPVSLSGLFRTLWPQDQLVRLIGGGWQPDLGYPFATLYLVLIVLGFWILWRRNRTLGLFLLTPICLTLGAAVARQYPFTEQLILFLIPSFFIAIGVSAEQMRLWLNRWSKPLGVLAPLLIAAAAVYPMAKTPPVYRLEDMKPVLAYLQERRRAGDSIYVYYGAAPEVTFYAASVGLRDSDYAVGGCHRGDAPRYFQELDEFRGRPRLWVLLTHAQPRHGEAGDILRYLDTIGLRRDSFVIESRLVRSSGAPAEVFLYDLSDPVLLSRAAPVSMPVTGRSAANAASTCAEGPQAMVPPRGLSAR
jgi:hypothetical protein